MVKASATATADGGGAGRGKTLAKEKRVGGVHNARPGSAADDGDGPDVPRATRDDAAEPTQWTGGARLLGFALDKPVDAARDIALETPIPTSPDQLVKDATLQYVVTTNGACFATRTSARSYKQMKPLAMCDALIKAAEEYDSPSLKETAVSIFMRADGSELRPGTFDSFMVRLTKCWADARTKSLGDTDAMAADAAALHLANQGKYWKALRGLAGNPLGTEKSGAKTKGTSETALAEATLRLNECIAKQREERRHHAARLQAMQAELARLSATQEAKATAASEDTEEERFAAAFVQAVGFVNAATAAGLSPEQRDALMAKLDAELDALNQPRPSERTMELQQEYAEIDALFVQAAQRSAELSKTCSTGTGFEALAQHNQDDVSVVLKKRDAAAMRLQAAVAADRLEMSDTPRVALFGRWQAALRSGGKGSKGTHCPDPRPSYDNRQGGGPVTKWGKPDPRKTKKKSNRKPSEEEQQKGQAKVDAGMNALTPRGSVPGSVHTEDVGEAGSLKRKIRAYISTQQARRHYGTLVTKQGRFAGVHYRDRRGRLKAEEVSARQVFVTVPSDFDGPIPETIMLVLNDEMDWETCQSMTAKSWKPASAADAQQSS